MKEEIPRKLTVKLNALVLEIEDAHAAARETDVSGEEVQATAKEHRDQLRHHRANLIHLIRSGEVQRWAGHQLMAVIHWMAAWTYAAQFLQPVLSPTSSSRRAAMAGVMTELRRCCEHCRRADYWLLIEDPDWDPDDRPPRRKRIRKLYKLARHAAAHGIRQAACDGYEFVLDPEGRSIWRLLSELVAGVEHAVTTPPPHRKAQCADYHQPPPPEASSIKGVRTKGDDSQLSVFMILPDSVAASTRIGIGSRCHSMAIQLCRENAGLQLAHAYRIDHSGVHKWLVREARSRAWIEPHAAPGVHAGSRVTPHPLKISGQEYITEPLDTRTSHLDPIELVAIDVAGDLAIDDTDPIELDSITSPTQTNTASSLKPSDATCHVYALCRAWSRTLPGIHLHQRDMADDVACACLIELVRKKATLNTPGDTIENRAHSRAVRDLVPDGIQGRRCRPRKNAGAQRAWKQDRLWRHGRKLPVASPIEGPTSICMGGVD